MPKAHHLSPSLSQSLMLRLTALRAGLRAAILSSDPSGSDDCRGA